MKFNNLIEVRNYLYTIPEDKWNKEGYFSGDKCCGVGHVAKALNNGEKGGILKAFDLLESFSVEGNEIINVNDASESPKHGVIEFLNQRIYELAN